MEERLQSPLTQQTRPTTFKPKIVELYEAIFAGDADPSEGFWRELFLLRPDQKSLQQIALAARPTDLLTPELSTLTRQLFSRAIQCVQSGEAPLDEHALDTLTIFLESVLSKRYPQPSSDVIEILAGLDQIDSTFADFTNALDTTIREGRTPSVRQKAVRAGLAATAGAYSTGLVTYFVNRDLFPSFIKLIEDADDHDRAFGPLVLLGLLANYNKFEFQNPYQLRLQDFVTATAMRTIAVDIGLVLEECRDKYLAIQPDQAETWSLGGAMSSLRLSLLGGGSRMTAQGVTEEQTKAALAEQPSPETCIILPLYDLVHTNKLFCSVFVSCDSDTQPTKRPIVAFLSLVSYALQNAHRSPRAGLYACHMVQIIQILVEDPVVVQSLCDTASMASIHFARQRPPFLPNITAPRPLALAILDLAIDGINHNLRRRLDVDLYILLLGLPLRILTFCVRTRTKLVYHWSELWKSLLSFMRFLNTHAESLTHVADIEIVTGLAVQTIALALAAGEGFLPDAKSFDDLFYKIFESGEVLTKFGDLFAIPKTRQGPALAMLANASGHFSALLAGEKNKGKQHLSPREVARVIKTGYDDLAMETVPGLDEWKVYHEGSHRNSIKRVARATVHDVRTLLSQRPL